MVGSRLPAARRCHGSREGPSLAGEPATRSPLQGTASENELAVVIRRGSLAWQTNQLQTNFKSAPCGSQPPRPSPRAAVQTVRVERVCLPADLHATVGDAQVVPEGAGGGFWCGR